MKQEKLEQLRQVLAASGAAAWEITDTAENGWEFYLIGPKLDQHRVRNVNHVRLRVYSRGDDEAMMGAAEGEVPPTADAAEMEETVRGLLDAARYTLNPAWPLNAPAGKQPQAEITAPDVEKIAGDFLRTLSGLPQDESTGINSSEIFVTGVTKRILNSEGLDVTDAYPASMAEVIVNARDQAHEIELYRMFRSGACDAAGLAARLHRAMRYGRDKLVARATPAIGNIDLVLSTEAAVEVYYWYAAHLNASFLYRGYSDWKLGEPITAAADGDPVTILARAALPNSSRNCRFDDEGAWTRDLTLLEKNVPRAFFGSRQFAHYLGLQNTFQPGNFEVPGGTSGAEALRAGDYLEVVEFSSFEVNAVSGDLAGEIRLGYLHQGGQVIIVSGGSVSANMADLTAGIRMSRETSQYNNFLIPTVTRLRNVSVTGGQLDT